MYMYMYMYMYIYILYMYIYMCICKYCMCTNTCIAHYSTCICSLKSYKIKGKTVATIARESAAVALSV